LLLSKKCVSVSSVAATIDVELGHGWRGHVDLSVVVELVVRLAQDGDVLQRIVQWVLIKVGAL
jgi:hypothetical protein